MSSLTLEYSFLNARPIRSSMTERLDDVLRTEAENDPAFRRLTVYSRNLPSWAEDERDFWNTDDHWELGCKGREITVGFSDPLSQEVRETIFRTFATCLLSDRYAYTAVIRRRTASRKSRASCDWHIAREAFVSGHILFCERRIDPSRPEPPREEYFCRPRKNKEGEPIGGYRKDTGWSQSYNRGWIIKARLLWCKLVNTAMEQAGHDGRIGLNPYGGIYPAKISDPFDDVFVPAPLVPES